MANNDEMAMLFAIENIEQHERYIHVRQSRNQETITDPFTYSDRLFIKNYRLTKELVTNLIELIRPHIVSKRRSSAIDLKTKVSTYTKSLLFFLFEMLDINFCVIENLTRLGRRIYRLGTKKFFKKYIIYIYYIIQDDYTVIQVLVTLNFLATGSYQSPIGNSRFTSVSQPTVSRCISEVVAAINHPEIFHVWVKFPKDMNELTEVRNE